MLRLNTIRQQPGAHRDSRRRGRGPASGLGGTAGKGHKGQLARSGGHVRPGFEGGQTPLYRRVPKRGFTQIHRVPIVAVNVEELSRFGGKEVTLASLQEAGIVKGRFDRLTILAKGELNKKLAVKAHKFSPAAKEKIEKAGGSVEVLPIRQKYIRPKKKSGK